MNIPNVRVGSRVHSIGPERGVVLVASTGTHCHHEVKAVKNSGRSLEIFGALASLLHVKSTAGKLGLGRGGQRHPVPGSRIELVLSSSIYPTVKTALTTGEILETSAVHVLRAVIDTAELFARTGITLELVEDECEFEPEQLNAFESAIARETRNQSVHAEKIASWSLPAEDAAWVRDNQATVVYTDGSCVASSGFAAWAWFVDEERNGVGTVAPATSSYAERRAALGALTAVPGPVLLVTDCANLVAPHSNRVLSVREARVLKSLRRLVDTRQVRILTVKGHSICPGNLRVDALASGALTEAWSKISADGELHARFLKLNSEFKANLKEARRLANERRTLHADRYGTPRSRRQKRRRKEAARKKATAPTSSSSSAA